MGAEERVVQERALEDKVDQRVEEVPDEDCADFGGGGAMRENEDGEGVGEEEEDEDEEEGADCNPVNEGRGRVHGGLLWGW